MDDPLEEVHPLAGVGRNDVHTLLLREFGAYYGVGELYQHLAEAFVLGQNLRGALQAPQVVGHPAGSELVVDHLRALTEQLQLIGRLAFQVGGQMKHQLVHRDGGLVRASPPTRSDARMPSFG